MKISVDLEEFWTDDDTIANAIRGALREEIEKHVRTLVKQRLKEQHKTLVTEIDRAIEASAKKIAAAAVK